MSAQGQGSKAGSETVGPVGRCRLPGRIQLAPKGPLALPAGPASPGSSASFSAFESCHTPPPLPIRLPAGTVPRHGSAPPSLLCGLGSRAQVQGPGTPAQGAQLPSSFPLPSEPPHTSFSKNSRLITEEPRERLISL